MRDRPNIVEFTTDKQLMGLDLSSAQETLQRAIYGLSMSPEQAEIFRACTGRETPPTSEFAEATILAGARAGKDSRIASPTCCYEAAFGGHERHLARGEQATIALVAQDQRATAIAFGYIRAAFTQSPVLRNLLADEPKANSLELVTGIRVQCFPSTTGAGRGWSIPVGILDELAFFRFEGAANSDAEIQMSIRRGMVAFPRTKLVKISTPYMRSGVLFSDFSRAFGKDDPDLLVWRASSELMNPSIGRERLDRERRLDPQRYVREYEAEFTDDVAAFVPRDWVDAAVVGGRYELPPSKSGSATMAIDPSGGGLDAFTAAIVFSEGTGPDQRITQAVMRGAARVGTTAPDLEGLVREYADLARQYGCHEIVTDRYAAGWVEQALKRHGIHCKHADVDRSAAYLNLEPLLAQRRIELLDHPQMIRELELLERRPRPGGKDLVEHPRGGHDDYINAVALAAAYATVKQARPVVAFIMPDRSTPYGHSTSTTSNTMREMRWQKSQRLAAELAEARARALARRHGGVT